MANDPDDLSQLIRAIQVDSSPDRILVREVLSSKNVVNDGHSRRALIVLAGNEASSPKGDIHNLEIIRSHNIMDRPVHLSFTRGFRLTFKPKKVLVISSHWKRLPCL